MSFEQSNTGEQGSESFTKLASEPFDGREHQKFTDYYEAKYGKPSFVPRNAIMDTWSDQVIISENIATCYPIIAFNKEDKCQMIHYSQDPWHPTNYEEYQKKIKEWKSMGCEVYLIKAPRTTALVHDDELSKLFGDRYHQLDITEDTSYSLVIDVKKTIY